MTTDSIYPLTIYGYKFKQINSITKKRWFGRYDTYTYVQCTVFFRVNNLERVFGLMASGASSDEALSMLNYRLSDWEYFQTRSTYYVYSIKKWYEMLHEDVQLGLRYSK